MSIQATIAITADWLCKHRPVVFTNRTKDQPLMADPFPIYQQVVKDNEAFFRDVHGYVPLSNTKTGLAGVRSRVYTKVWRDKVILPALRIYRARTEGASLDTVPEVTFSQKTSCATDGPTRASRSAASWALNRRMLADVTSTTRIATQTCWTCLLPISRRHGFAHILGQRGGHV